MNQGQQKNILIAIGIIFVAMLSRLIPIHNFSAVGAVGLFGAAYFGKKWMAFLLPFVALWISDLFLNNVIYSQYYDSFVWFANPFVYIGFAAFILFGIVYLKKINTSRIVVSAIVVSLIFFLVSNFGSWLAIPTYPKTISGLLSAYAAGLPFLDNTLAGNLFYSLVLFKTYEWIKVNDQVLATA